MGRGARPAKAKSLTLVPGNDPGEPAGDIPEEEAGQLTQASSTADQTPAEQQGEAPPPDHEETPRAEARVPDLAELQAVKERIRLEHPDWYPEFRDTFGEQFNDLLVPHLAGLTPQELGLPPGTDPDRQRRELRALAFARSCVMAEAGDAEGLRAISEDLLYYWDDRLDGKLLPPPVISPDDRAPWVHSLNRLRSRRTDRVERTFRSDARFRRFVDGVKGWTDGRWRQLREASKRVLEGQVEGTDERQALELIEAVRAADNDAPRLWRRERSFDVAQRLGVRPDQLLTHLRGRVGDELTQDLVSTSSSSHVWSGDFVWEVEPGAQAIHAYPVSYYPSEKEWITAGQFRVLAVEATGHGGVKVRVEQTGVFSPEPPISSKSAGSPVGS
jgi:hypothetical protein